MEEDGKDQGGMKEKIKKRRREKIVRGRKRGERQKIKEEEESVRKIKRYRKICQKN